jgi:hypothetical protein
MEAQDSCEVRNVPSEKCNKNHQKHWRKQCLLNHHLRLTVFRRQSMWTAW